MTGPDGCTRGGTVASFDDAVGLGRVTAEDGTDLGFHCTRIADGTRTIAAGSAVDFEVVAARHGRWEASNLRPPPMPARRANG